MKSTSQLVLLFASLAEAKTLGENSKLDYWTSSEGTAGFLAFFFLLFFAYTSFGLLGAIEVPMYQL